MQGIENGGPLFMVDSVTKRYKRPYQWVVVLASCPGCHLRGKRAHYGVNAATHRAEMSLLSRCARAASVKRA